MAAMASHAHHLLVTQRTDLEEFDVEGLWLQILPPKPHNFILGIIDCSPSSSEYHDKNFMAKFEDILKEAFNNGEEVLIWKI